MQITIDRISSTRRVRFMATVLVAGVLLGVAMAVFYFATGDQNDGVSLPQNTRPMIMMPLPRF